MNIIKSSTEISHLFEYGTRYKCPFVTFIVNFYSDKQDNDSPGKGGRVAFIAGKKLGNSVWRNSARRRMKAVCHDIGGPWADYDVIFLAKSTLMNESYSKVLRVCRETIQQDVMKTQGKGKE